MPIPAGASCRVTRPRSSCATAGPGSPSGLPGGHTITQAVAQMIMNVVDFDMNIQEAIAAPRIAFVEPDVLVVEKGIPQSIRDQLSARGHHIEVGTIGNAHGLTVEYDDSGKPVRFTGGDGPPGRRARGRVLTAILAVLEARAEGEKSGTKKSPVASTTGPFASRSAIRLRFGRPEPWAGPRISRSVPAPDTAFPYARPRECAGSSGRGPSGPRREPSWRCPWRRGRSGCPC